MYRCIVDNIIFRSTAEEYDTGFTQIMETTSKNNIKFNSWNLQGQEGQGQILWIYYHGT